MSEWFKERAWKVRIRHKRIRGSNPRLSASPAEAPSGRRRVAITLTHPLASPDNDILAPYASGAKAGSDNINTPPCVMAEQEPDETQEERWQSG